MMISISRGDLNVKSNVEVFDKVRIRRFHFSLDLQMIFQSTVQARLGTRVCVVTGHTNAVLKYR